MTIYIKSKKRVAQSVKDRLPYLKPDSQLIITISRAKSEGYYVSIATGTVLVETPTLKSYNVS